MNRSQSFNTGTASRGDQSYSIPLSTKFDGPGINSQKFEGPA